MKRRKKRSSKIFLVTVLLVLVIVVLVLVLHRMSHQPISDRERVVQTQQEEITTVPPDTIAEKATISQVITEPETTTQSEAQRIEYTEQELAQHKTIYMILDSIFSDPDSPEFDFSLTSEQIQAWEDSVYSEYADIYGLSKEEVEFIYYEGTKYNW